MKSVVLGVVCCALFAGAQAQTNPVRQTVYRLMQSKDPGAKDSLRSILDTLSASSQEDHLALAANAYAGIKENHRSDSLQKVILEKFPAGVSARGIAEQGIYEEKDPSKKEQLYDAWEAQFPPSRFPDKDHDHIVYDYAKMSISHAYADAGNVAKAMLWAGKTEEDFYKGNVYGGLGEVFLKQDKLAEAEVCIDSAMLSARKYYEMKDGDNADKFAASGYPGLLGTYIDILTKEKKYKQALPLAQKALALQTEPNPHLAFSCAKLMMTQHQYKEAFSQVEPIVKAGQANTEVLDTFKVLYVKVNGSLKGYDAYAEAIHKAFLQDMHNRLTKEKIDLSAPDFSLTDVDGKKVTLSDYRGKTVILDFWATWCGPCKASFPSMKRVIEKYKSDTSVIFLFIHTWERDSTAAAATKNAKDFVVQHDYPFEVLMDLKDPATGDHAALEAYKVSGIPTKFVVTKDGRIRFRFTGFSEGDDAAVEEVSAMINMAQM